MITEWLLVGVGALQLFVFAWQGIQLRRTVDATNAAADVAKKEFLSTHRPRLILREAFIGSILEGQDIAVFFSIANVGETVGTIVKSIVDIEVVGGQRLLIASSAESANEIGNISFAPGVSRLLKFNDLNKRPNSSGTPRWEAAKFAEKTKMEVNEFGQSRQVSFHDPVVHFVGQFIYVDEAGIARRTAFRRLLVPERQRFYRLEGEPDLDYAD